MTSEITKDSKHTTNNLFPGSSAAAAAAEDKYDFFTQEEKDKLEMVIRREILEVENIRIRYGSLSGTNRKVHDMLNKEINTLENILKKINNDT